jgi:hypothetical protein
MRKAITAVAVLLLLVLAGCSGGVRSSDSAAPDGAAAGGAAGQATPQRDSGATGAPTATGTKHAGTATGTGTGTAKAGTDSSTAGAKASGTKVTQGGKPSESQASSPKAGAGKTKGSSKSTGAKVGGAAAATSKGAGGGAGAAGGSDAAPGSSAAGGSGNGDTAAPPAQTIADKAPAAKRYREIDDAYTASLRDLLKALATRPLNMKAVRAGVRKSTTGYEARLASLQAVQWPSDVQPTVDQFLELASTTGLQMFKEMEQAQSPADLTGRADKPAPRKLRSAEIAMRAALGLANPTGG